jgi:hypothetical protein
VPENGCTYLVKSWADATVETLSRKILKRRLIVIFMQVFGARLFEPFEDTTLGAFKKFVQLISAPEKFIEIIAILIVLRNL